jgi:hypothetical protein
MGLAEPDDLVEDGFDFAERRTQSTDELFSASVGATLRVVRARSRMPGVLPARGPRD